MPSPLYPIIDKRISDATNTIVTFQVTPWIFLTSGKPFIIKKFDGGEISYEGVSYEGSPEVVFWGRYIEPFIEQVIVQEIAFSIDACQKRQLDALSVLSDMENLLTSLISKVFASMSDVDTRLRGGVYPNAIETRSTKSEQQGMIHFLQMHIDAERVMWQPKAQYEKWYEKNKFWVWFIGILVGVASLVIKFY